MSTPGPSYDETTRILALTAVGFVAVGVVVGAGVAGVPLGTATTMGLCTVAGAVALVGLQRMWRGR